MLNLSLMARWENWITILLMLLIASFAMNSFARVVFKKGNTDNA
jgi:hypothetical protein